VGRRPGRVGGASEHKSLDAAPVPPVDILPLASVWQQEPARGGRPEMYTVRTGVGRVRGTLDRGTPVPPRAGTVFPYSDRPSRFPRGEAPASRGTGGAGAPESTPASRRRGACSFCGHLGPWLWECPAQFPEVQAHGQALREAVAAHRSGRGPAPPPLLTLRSGPLVAPSPPAVAATGSAPPGTAALVHAVDTEDRAHPDAAADEGGSSSEEWTAGDDDAARPCHAQGNV